MSEETMDIIALIVYLYACFVLPLCLLPEIVGRVARTTVPFVLLAFQIVGIINGADIIANIGIFLIMTLPLFLLLYHSIMERRELKKSIKEYNEAKKNAPPDDFLKNGFDGLDGFEDLSDNKDLSDD